MKTLKSNGRNLGMCLKSVVATMLLLGAAMTASAQSYGTQSAFPGLDDGYGTTTLSYPASYDYNHPVNDYRTPGYDAPASNNGYDPWSPDERAGRRRDPNAGYARPVDYRTNRPSYNDPYLNQNKYHMPGSYPSTTPNTNAYPNYNPTPANDPYLNQNKYHMPGSYPGTTPNTNPYPYNNGTTTPGFPGFPTTPASNPYDGYTPLPMPGGNTQPLPPSTPIDPEVEEFQKSQQKVSFRYRNPVLMRFVQSLTSSKAIELYREINDMVDQRSLTPTSYAERVNKSLSNLKIAARNTDFQQVNNLRVSTQAIAMFEQTLDTLARNQNVRSRTDAEQVMSQVMGAAQQQLGVSPQVVALEFIFGTTDTLDKYSAFVPDDIRLAPSASAVEDSVVGIGVEIKKVETGLLIERVLTGGPAQEAGLQAGDIVVNVDGRSLQGLTIDAAVDLIGGPSGSRIQMGIQRGSQPAFAVSMIRRRVEIQTVNDVRMIDSANKVGYFRLDKFAEKSSAEMDKALWSLHNQGMKSLVLDLRGNPGGLLTSAIDLSNKFLTQGVIVSTRGRLSQDNSSESASRTQTWKIPLVVLVDENSASASEIFAAAIQENGRGVIVGRKSYGKGTVQTHFSLRSVPGALRLTTAKFYSPDGREMAGAGVTPDVLVNDFVLDSRMVSNGDKDIRAALQVTSTPELALMSARSAQPRVPGYSLSDRR